LQPILFIFGDSNNSSIHPSVCLFASLSVCLPLYLSVCLPACLSVCLSVSQSVSQSTNQPINQSINQFSSDPLVILLHNPLHFRIPIQVMVVVFLLVKKSFVLAISYPPFILHVHAISMHCFPFLPKSFVLPPFFL